VANILSNFLQARKAGFGDLGDNEIAKSKTSRDIVPSEGSALPGHKKKKKTAAVQGVDKQKLINETKVVGDVLEKVFPWIYKKPPDKKGETKIFEQAKKQQLDSKKRGEAAKKTISILGKIAGIVALAMTVWTLFKDKIKEIWDNIKTKLGEWFDKFPSIFKAALRLAIPILKGVFKIALKILLAPLKLITSAVKGVGTILKGVWTTIKGLAKLIFTPIVAVVKGVITAVKGVIGGVGKLFGKSVATGTTKLAAKAAEAAAKKKAASKGVGKAVGKSLLKKIPGVGLIAGLGFGIMRAAKGDFAGAAMEFASGAASTVPGIGTAASIGIDAALIARDIHKAKKATAVEDGIINPDGGLVVQGRKGSFKLDKKDSVIASPLKKFALGALALTPFAPLVAAGVVAHKVKQKKQEQVMKIEAKRFSDYESNVRASIKSSSKMLVLLSKIEQNTRSSGNPTIVNTGQQKSTGGDSASSSPNTVAPNIGVTGANKLDSRAGYMQSPYSINPNSLVT
tara:strand:- start:266 stop:1798 length:1533 start_codon:yes stop_codon:yes gene_type:complete